jgi:hypothetical protein
MATRPLRGFDPNHSHIEWLKRQGFFVWRSYPKKIYTSAKFAEIAAKDARQILRLNELLDQAVAGRWPEKSGTIANPVKTKAAPVVQGLDRLGEVKPKLYTPDF